VPTTPTVPITLLQAVNELLRAVGTAPVSTLEAASTNVEVSQALDALNDEAVKVLSMGWHFNSDTVYPMTPNAVNGTIVMPPNAIFKGVSDRSSQRFVTERQNMLWDLKNKTYAWINGTDGLSNNPDPLNGPLYIDLCWLFDFEDCPQPIRWLITAQAGNLFGTGKVPDQDTYRFTDVVQEEALANALVWDGDSSALYAEDNPHFWYMRKR
jgi:hypothetical protein